MTDEPAQQPAPPTPPPAPAPKPKAKAGAVGVGVIVLQVLFQIVLPILVVAGAGYLLWQMLESEPEVQRADVQAQARLVEVTPAQTRTGPITVDAMGTVVSAREVQLKPRVSGQIQWVSPELAPGGRFKAGQPMLRIDRTDYELAVQQRQSDVAVARGNVADAQRQLTLARGDLMLEQGNQSVARQEYDLLGGADFGTEDEGGGGGENVDENAEGSTAGTPQRGGSDEGGRVGPPAPPGPPDIPGIGNLRQSRALVLRKPQLEAAQANVKAAKAGVDSAQASLASAQTQLKQANLDLQRTTILAPFDAVVQEKMVTVGDTVSTSTPLVHLIGTDRFWVDLAVPEQELKWIDAGGFDGEAGSAVRITNPSAWPGDAHRSGYVLRRMPSVNAQGRMARLLVSVDDPLAIKPEHLGMPRMLVGSYVEGSIQGRSVTDTVAIPRELLRNGREVWVMNDRDKLEVRQVQTLYRGRDEVLIASGLEAGERVVRTDLSMAVAGMPLKTGSSVADAGATGAAATAGDARAGEANADAGTDAKAKTKPEDPAATEAAARHAPAPNPDDRS